MTLWLHGMGHAHPENEITNRFLQELDIGTNEAWILERVGIRSRRTALSLDYIRETRNSDVRGCAEASEWTVAQLGAKAAEIAVLLASHTDLASYGGPGVTSFSSGPKRVPLDAVLLDPVPITRAELHRVIDAGWVSKDVVCRGTNADPPPACR